MNHENNKTVLGIIAKLPIFIGRVFIYMGVALSSFMGQPCVIRLDLIDEDGCGAPEENEYKTELESIEEGRIVRPITVTLTLFAEKPFHLTDGGAASYKALRHKGEKKGPVDLG